ncbi:hypothetical protein NY406_07770 [Chlorobaculum sp. MV4-Y]|uniref:hypothetical protein n=1 Tax=Chlorobaculum sp. MV4-Y TaxID=2976335 RepID=UPI0021AEA9A7|nr:hypothetical protein [Chlorobaculum sp. MV4-Y]UWX57115.1 hypothetical protein NY406_07770 [Chlorobaculum sp. MV4-Y]
MVEKKQTGISMQRQCDLLSEIPPKNMTAGSTRDNIKTHPRHYETNTPQVYA